MNSDIFMLHNYDLKNLTDWNSNGRQILNWNGQWLRRRKNDMSPNQFFPEGGSLPTIDQNYLLMQVYNENAYFYNYGPSYYLIVKYMGTYCSIEFTSNS